MDFVKGCHLEQEMELSILFFGEMNSYLDTKCYIFNFDLDPNRYR